MSSTPDDDVMAYVTGEKTLAPAPAPLRAVPDPAEGEATQPMEVVPVAPAVLAGRQMGFLDQARGQAGYTLMQMREARHREGSVAHRLWHGQPRSMAMQADHVRNRRWVKPGHEGGVADKGVTGYHKLIGNQMVAAGTSIAAIGGAPLAFFYTYFGVLSLAELGLWLAGDPMIAIWVAVIHVAVVVVAVLALCALTGQRDEDETEDAEATGITEPEEG